MKVLFDHQAFTMQYFGGVSKCFCELIMHRPVGMDFEISIEQSNNIHLRDSNLLPNLQPVGLDFRSLFPQFNFKGKHWVYSHIISNLYATTEKLNERKSIDAIIKGNFDVFHPTFFSTYFLPHINKKPFVITIHDMTPELFPQYFRNAKEETARKKKLCEKASCIIAVSSKTKSDLVKLFGIDDKKIHVVYHGAPSVSTFRADSAINGEYFLYVGQRDAYKNFEKTLHDFSIFCSKHKDVKLVCTGSPFTGKELYLIDTLKIKKNIEHIKASESEMHALYQHAIAFIYPSLYEGFGMPILEAFANKCPVLLNNTSCFPEIGGDAALYFESDAKESNLCELLEYIYGAPDTIRRGLVEKGLLRVKGFSWSESSFNLLEVYKSCI